MGRGIHRQSEPLDFKTVLFVGLVLISVTLSSCSRQHAEPKELPQILGTDAERGKP